MLMMTTHRPRNVDAFRAGGILYGDWGTSKAYVIGIAFALVGYASFWPILAVSILSLCVGLSYTMICKYYPNGGGVYASVRRRSKWLSIVGAFFLVADYLVTAALSALAAFSYFGSPDPVVFSAIFIVLIGLLNYYGPRHSGMFALIIAIAAFAVFTGLAITSIPFLGRAWENVQPFTGSPLTFWTQFCSVIVALSGVETIANTTSIMKLNRGSTLASPVVTSTSTPAILAVMTEVVVYTTLFGLAASAIGNFQIHNQSISAPGFTHIENDMLSYLARVFATDLFGSAIGTVFSQVLSIVVGLILLSAVNTAINGLVSLQYLMASDDELPKSFQKVNRFGMPLFPLAIAAVLPAILILVFRKIVLLADLYAIGFVGAIATNLGATSTDTKLPLQKFERVFMFCVFLIMAAIEVTLFIQKTEARYFALLILAGGLALRWVAVISRKKAAAAEKAPAPLPEPRKGAILCVVKRFGKAVRIAIEESNTNSIPLDIVFIRELRVISEKDLKSTPENDSIAKKVFDFVTKTGNPELVHFHYSVTDSFPDIAAAYALRFESTKIYVDAPPSYILTVLRGNYVDMLREYISEDIPLIVVKSK